MFPSQRAKRNAAQHRHATDALASAILRIGSSYKSFPVYHIHLPQGCGCTPSRWGAAVLLVYERAGGLTYGEVEVGQETIIFDPESLPDR